MNIESIIYKIKKETGIDLSKQIELDSNILELSVFSDYILEMSRYVVEDILHRFYITYKDDNIILHFNSDFVTELGEPIQTTSLGNFDIGKKYKVGDDYYWDIFIKDRFDNIIDIQTFSKNSYIYKYLDAIIKYCTEKGNKEIL